MNKLSWLLIPTLLILGCAAPKPNVVIPPIPIQTESVLPNIQKVDSGISDTITTNTKIGSKIDESKQTVLDQKVSIVEALAQAEKIKEKALAKVAITELEALNLIDELKDVESRNMFLEKQNQELDKLKLEQDKTLKLIQDTLDKTKVQVINKENETQALRDHSALVANELVYKTQEANKLKTELTKEKEKSAKAGVYRNWVIGLAVGFIAWTIIKNLLMIYFPLSKFRI